MRRNWRGVKIQKWGRRRRDNQAYPKERRKVRSITISSRNDLDNTKHKFLDAVNHVWERDALDDPRITFSVREGSNIPVLAKIRVSEGGRVIGDSLVSVPRKVTLIIDPRFYDEPDDMQWKILVHEAVHLGYMNHGKNFRKLVTEKGGAASEQHGRTGKIKLQGKLKKDKYGRYKTIKSFNTESELMNYANKYARDHPNTIFRVEM